MLTVLIFQSFLIPHFLSQCPVLSPSLISSHLNHQYLTFPVTIPASETLHILFPPCWNTLSKPVPLENSYSAALPRNHITPPDSQLSEASVLLLMDPSLPFCPPP